MPNYDLICKKCKRKFEEFLKLSEANPPCKCGGETEKLISPVYGKVTGSEHRPIDCIVGADSEKRWEHVENRKNKRKLKNAS
jgi:putative FmdB family regulatory protein